MHVAKINLIRADPNSDVSRIYFNPALTPVEAEQAYLRRKERREKRLRLVAVHGVQH